MKKILIILLSLMCYSQMLMAQIEDKTEYRYWNFVLGLNHGFGSALGSDYANLMIHTNKGDMHQKKQGFTYTPGIQLGFVYNIDLQNNKTGIVAGAEVVDYGFANKYKSTDNSDYDMKETFRAIGIQIPILFKFSGSDIYRDMKYAYIGVKPTFNFMVSRGHKGSWTSEKYGEKLTDGKKPLSVAATFGFNFNIYSFSINYQFMEFVNSKYTDGNGFTPFKGVKGHIYVCTSLNVPMTRWLCINNWTAEKIRRKLHNGKTM